MFKRIAEWRENWVKEWNSEFVKYGTRSPTGKKPPPPPPPPSKSDHITIIHKHYW